MHVFDSVVDGVDVRLYTNVLVHNVPDTTCSQKAVVRMLPTSGHTWQSHKAACVLQVRRHVCLMQEAAYRGFPVFWLPGSGDGGCGEWNTFDGYAMASSDFNCSTYPFKDLRHKDLTPPPHPQQISEHTNVGSVHHKPVVRDVLVGT